MAGITLVMMRTNDVKVSARHMKVSTMVGTVCRENLENEKCHVNMGDCFMGIVITTIWSSNYCSHQDCRHRLCIYLSTICWLYQSCRRGVLFVTCCNMLGQLMRSVKEA